MPRTPTCQTAAPALAGTTGCRVLSGHVLTAEATYGSFWDFGGKIMTRYRSWLLSTVLGMVCAGGGVRGSEDAVGNTPWHYVDYWWHFEKPVVFQSYSVDIEISGEVDPNQKLYIAPIGIGHLNGKGFYGGIQTQTDGFTPETGKQRQYIGKGAIFSRWDERDFAAIRRSQGGLWESGGYEGPFISVRNHYPWTQGRHTYSVRRLETETVGDKVVATLGEPVDREKQQGATRRGKFWHQKLF